MTEYIRYSAETLEIQRKLNQVRSDYHHNSDSWPHLAEDGLYGPQTAKAVEAFKVTYNLGKSDRIVEVLDKKLNERWIQTGKGWLNNMETHTGNISFFLNDDFVWMKSLLQKYDDVIAKKIEAGEKKFWKFDIEKARNYPSHLPYIGIISWICQLFTTFEFVTHLKEKRRRGELTSAEYWAVGIESFTLTAGGADVFLTLKNKHPWVESRYANFVKMFLTTKNSELLLTFLKRLSVAGQCIGAYMIGCAVVEVIGSIPVPFCPGVTVQDRIDDLIDFCWRHPEVLIPISPLTAIRLIVWKKCIDWRVNMIPTLKPLSEADRIKYEKYLIEKQLIID